MKPRIVVDASAPAAVMFAEPEMVLVQQRLQGVEFLAPALLRYEVTNITLTKMRRRPDRIDAYRKTHENFMRLEINLADVDCSAVLALAQKRKLTA